MPRLTTTFRNLFITVLLALLSSGLAEGDVTVRNPDLKFGAYTYGGVWSGMQPVLQLEAALGRRLDIVHWFMSWDNDWDARLIQPLSDSGRLPMLSWQPFGVDVADIAAGRHDTYLNSWAAGAAAYGHVVYIRPFPEMNGNWTSWNGQPEQLVAAWRHIVDVFDAHGADNVRWVWSPNVLDEPRTADNRMELYYPGEQYVDVLALDGYNWGSTRSYIGWQSFSEMLDQAYGRITALGSQPLWMAETASAEAGGDKSAWIADMFADSHLYPQLDAIVWFDENKETDWRIASSPAALASFQHVLPALGGELASATP